MKFRLARHTKKLEPIIDFYTKILGLEILGSFNNHDNYDGVFLGKKNLDWHLEFTVSNEKPEHKIDEDDLLVFYVNSNEYNQITDKCEKNNIKKIEPKNPYWKQNGIIYRDPDEFLIVISILEN